MEINEHPIKFANRLKELERADTFTPTAKNARKRTNSDTTSDIPLKNKFEILSSDMDDMEHSDNNAQDNPPTSSGNPDDPSPAIRKERIDPFYVEFEGHYKNTLQPIVKLTNIDPYFKLDGDKLKIHCKSTEDFRIVQAYLDDNNMKYTTLSPKETRPKKVLLRGMPPFTPEADIIDGFAIHGFSVSRAAMMKSRKTQKPMPMYVCNVLPCQNFDKIYDIRQINFLSISVEHFRAQPIKQCYRCQGFGHASDSCKLTPKCVKCADKHLTNDCPSKGRITPKCANCGDAHVATYRGCPKNPINLKKMHLEKTEQSKNKNKTPQPVLTETLELAKIFSQYNYTKKPVISSNTTPNSNPPPPEVDKNNSPANIPVETPTTISTSNPTGTDSSLPQIPTPQEFHNITNTFSEIRELLKLTKLIASIRKIAEKTKKYTNPFDKLFAVISEFEEFSNELDSIHHG